MTSKVSSKVSGTFYLSTASFGGVCGAVGALAISGLSAMAMKRLGVEMQWLQVAASGAAGGVVGNLILGALMRLLRKLGFAAKPLDRFVTYFVSGFGLSLVLGGLVLYVVFRGEHGAIGPRLFGVIGWMVGLLASSLPLAILELGDDSAHQKTGSSPGAASD